MFGKAPEGQIWSGDDAAVVETPSGRTLLTIDTLVEHVDFETSLSAPQDVGWKAAAVNLSDIAAMGGRAMCAVTSLSLPGDTPAASAQELAAGLADCCDRYGVSMVGGDVSGASEISITVAVMGSSEEEPVTRAGARQGDLLCVTGRLGGAAAGLRAMRAGRSDGFPEPVSRQNRPEPRLEEGAALARAGATAMIDLSDGLARDLAHLVEASEVGCEVDVYNLPIDRGVEAVAAELNLAVLDLAVAGGEDFELLVALPADRLDEARAALAELKTPLTVIGRFHRGETTIAGRSLEGWKEKGWEHLRPR